MKNWWIRFGCFLIGYNYRIVRNSSEGAANTVKVYTAAIVVVSLLWLFIGYQFSKRYLDANLAGSVLGAIVAVTIIIQIERIIILTTQPQKWMYLSRAAIAFLMAALGAVVLDQIIFKKEIEFGKIEFVNDEVKRVLPVRTAELRLQLLALDSAIYLKNSERVKVMNNVLEKPLLSSTAKESRPQILKGTSFDSGRTIFNERIEMTMTTLQTQVENPNQKILHTLDGALERLLQQKNRKETGIVDLERQLSEELKSNIGLIHELKILANLISNSLIGILTYALVFLLFFGVELFVLVCKISNKNTDYEETVNHQMSLQIKKLHVLANMADRN